jgi:hypothetical protein
MSQVLPSFSYAANPFSLVNHTADKPKPYSAGEFRVSSTSYAYQQISNMGSPLFSSSVLGDFPGVVSPSAFAFPISNQSIPHTFPMHQQQFPYPLFSYHESYSHPGSSLIYPTPSILPALDRGASASSVSEGEYIDGHFSETMGGSQPKRRKSSPLLSSVSDVETSLQREENLKLSGTSNRVSENDGLDVLVAAAGSLEKEDIS